MAAIDPSAAPEPDEDNADAPPRATLKILREPIGEQDDDEDSDEDDDIDSIRRRLGEAYSDDEEDDDSDNEMNGGPSDPAKSKQAKAEAAIKKLTEALQADESMEDADLPNGINGKLNKGKAAIGEESDEDSDDSEGMDIEEFVLCTLDPLKVSCSHVRELLHYGLLLTDERRTINSRLTSL